jgi:hypothetical protein
MERPRWLLPPEVRAFTRDQIKPEGIVWKAAKRQHGRAERFALIEWSDELRATVDEAIPIKRCKLAGTWYVFGNLKGQRYTKGGWKATLSKLMTECAAEAKRRGTAFQRFSLQPDGCEREARQGCSRRHRRDAAHVRTHGQAGLRPSSSAHGEARALKFIFQTLEYSKGKRVRSRDLTR